MRRGRFDAETEADEEDLDDSGELEHESLLRFKLSDTATASDVRRMGAERSGAMDLIDECEEEDEMLECSHTYGDNPPPVVGRHVDGVTVPTTAVMRREMPPPSKRARGRPLDSSASGDDGDDDDDDDDDDDSVNLPPNKRQRDHNGEPRATLESAMQRAHELHQRRRPQQQKLDGQQIRHRTMGTLLDHARRRRMAVCVPALDACATYWQNKTDEHTEAFRNGVRPATTTVRTGVQRLHNIREDFKSLVPEWHPRQAEAFDQFVNVNIRLILGDDAETCLPAVMAENGWSDIKTELFVMAVRGTGKSAVSTAIAATFLWNIPNYNATVFAGIATKSVDSLDGIHDALVRLAEASAPQRYGSVHISKTRTQIVVRVSSTDVRRITCHSSFGGRVRLYSLSPAFIFSPALLGGGEARRPVDRMPNAWRREKSGGMVWATANENTGFFSLSTHTHNTTGGCGRWMWVHILFLFCRSTGTPPPNSSGEETEDNEHVETYRRRAHLAFQPSQPRLLNSTKTQCHCRWESFASSLLCASG